MDLIWTFIKWLIWGESCKKPSQKNKQISMRWSLGQNYFEGINMANRMTNEQKITASVSPKTAGGHDAPIDGVVTFTSSDESVVSIVVIDDKSASLVAVGPGVAQITASFDADLGEGVRTIEASGAMEVVAAEATTGEITFGEPEQQ